MDKSLRFNPNSEKDDIRQTTAANWELLRRSPEFQSVATQWIANGAFREQHVLEKKAYPDNIPARCALDWMLMPDQRYSLAQFQMRNSIFFWDPTANFGPIIVERHLERLTSGLRECIGNLFDVKRHPDPGHVLRIDQPWPATAPLFRDQFTSLFRLEDLKNITVGEEADWLLRVANYLVSRQSLSSEEIGYFARAFFQLGENLKGYHRDYKLFAIREQIYSKQHLDQILERIKDSIAFDPQTGHDHHSRRSFLGTSRQWEMFLAWEAHGCNAYSAAAEFLSKPSSSKAQPKQRRGNRSRSELQRDLASSVRQAQRAISQWIKRVYPLRDLVPATLRPPKQD